LDNNGHGEAADAQMSCMMAPGFGHPNLAEWGDQQHESRGFELARRSSELLPFDDVSRRLGLLGQHYVGIRPIPIERIVGSVDRSRDFDRQFRPTKWHLRTRLQGLRHALPEVADFPPISVLEVGGVYFVSDGHKRVAIARERDAASLDAEVVRLETSYDLPVDVDIRQLIHTEQQRLFMDKSGLDRARPEAVIEFSRPEGYPELLEVIKVHGYDMMHEQGELLDASDIASDWYDNVYLPACEALHREKLPQAYSYKTKADLFLWVYKLRRRLLVSDPSADFPEAARETRSERVSRRTRREARRERRSPLRRRG